MKEDRIRVLKVTPLVAPKRVKLSIAPTAEMLADVERLAQEDHCPMASIIYRAVEQYVKARTVAKPEKN